MDRDRGGPGAVADPIEAAVAEVRARIRAACERVGRDPGGVLLVAASKGVSIERMRLVAAAGVADFGENYARELAAKAPRVEATWHFIGRLQRGTAAVVAQHAEVVHSGVPGHGLERLSRHAQRIGRSVRCLVQVDETGRRQGVAPEDVPALVPWASTFTGIRMVGLMTLPAFTGDPESARPSFVRLRELRDKLRRTWPELRELSMGMSVDYEVATEEGATMVRVGSALFGARPAGAPGGPGGPREAQGSGHSVP